VESQNVFEISLDEHVASFIPHVNGSLTLEAAVTYLETMKEITIG
jgi:hypothetical protein